MMRRAALLLLIAALTACEKDGTTAVPTPQPPEGLQTLKHSQGIALTWLDKSINETSFEVEFALENGPYTLLATLPANQTTYTHTGTQPVLYHKYRVRACNAEGCSAYSNEMGRQGDYIPQAPNIVAVSVNAIAPTAATMNASVETGAVLTYLVFDIVPTGQSFDNAFRTERLPLTPQYDGEGFIRTNIGNSRIVSLQPATSYTFRAIVTNPVGVDTSAMVTFTTPN